MTTNRLEAFSDGVMAIIITIMVLEMKIPDFGGIESLIPIIPTFISYVLSFLYVGIYWNNHHHLWQAVEHVNGKILWANLHLLFWLSLFPVTTAWLGHNPVSEVPVALYGVVLFMASVAWYIMAKLVIQEEGTESKVATAYKNDIKTRISMGIYAFAIICAFIFPLASCIIYAVLAFLWLIPDTRIEKTLLTKK
ncbi:TMEM175 family protein [uncultured Cytophaga sp.]|uniref:TMEM175 family protein n=1 Tax=uncultured Cytophaga sp. TaxID=160238 RepID=UPI002613C7B6|nr:TMEM175 family protein [uncultured Cytophaga sp.]